MFLQLKWQKFAVASLTISKCKNNTVHKNYSIPNPKIVITLKRVISEVPLAASDEDYLPE
jgi:hypothetical protein